MQKTAISQNYLWVMSGRMMPLIALLFISILYSHSLSLDSYGVYQSVWMYANLVSVIMGYGIGTIIFSTQTNALFEFLKQNKKTILIFYLALWIISLLVFLAITNYPPALKFLVLVFILIQNSNTISETWLIKNGGERNYFFINVVYGILFFAWHYYILTHQYDLKNVIAGIVIIAALKFIFILLFRKRVQKTSFEQLDVKQFFPHWAFVGINDVLGIVSKWADKLILVYLLSPTEFAIFFNGSIEIPLLAIFIGMTGNYMMMQMSDGTNNHTAIVRIFRDNFLFLSSVVFPLFFFLIFFSMDLFPIFFGEKYMASVPIFIITILIFPFRINSFGSILQVFSKGNIVTRGSILDLTLATMLIFILYPVFGMKGAAASIVIASIIQICFYLYHTSRLLHVPVNALIPLKQLLPKFIIAGIIFYLLKLFTGQVPPVFAVAIAFTCVILFSLITGWKFILQISKKEKI